MRRPHGRSGARLVIGFPQCRQRRRVGLGHRQRQVFRGDPAENVVSERAPEHRAGANAASVVAAEGYDVVGEAMEAGQMRSSVMPIMPYH